jgi:hypothetical protein
MSTISTSEEPGARLLEALTSWATRLAPAEIQDSRYQAAFEAIDRALVATIRYMEGRRRRAGLSHPLMTPKSRKSRTLAR